MLLTVALVMAAMVLAMALPAFAVGPIDRRNESAPNCRTGNVIAYESPGERSSSQKRNAQASESLDRVYVDRCGGTINGPEDVA